METKDISLKKNQIGCGYCGLENICNIRKPDVNTAKLGCRYFEHFQDTEKRIESKITN